MAKAYGGKQASDWPLVAVLMGITFSVIFGGAFLIISGLHDGAHVHEVSAAIKSECGISNPKAVLSDNDTHPVLRNGHLAAVRIHGERVYVRVAVKGDSSRIVNVKTGDTICRVKR